MRTVNPFIWFLDNMNNWVSCRGYTGLMNLGTIYKTVRWLSVKSWNRITTVHHWHVGEFENLFRSVKTYPHIYTKSTYSNVRKRVTSINTIYIWQTVAIAWQIALVCENLQLKIWVTLPPTHLTLISTLTPHWCLTHLKQQ